MKRFILSFAVIAASLGLAAGAEASTATTTLNVSATFIPACTVSTTAVNFGSVTGLTTVTADGDVTVNCTSGIPYNIALDAGLHFTPDGRQISDGANSRTYELRRDIAGTWAHWGDSDQGNTFPFGSSLADTGTGAAQPHLVYGILNAGAAPPAGAYSDTVTVTVYY